MVCETTLYFCELRILTTRRFDLCSQHLTLERPGGSIIDFPNLKFEAFKQSK